MMVFRAHVFLLLAFMFPLISFPSNWTEHFQEEKNLFLRLPSICGNIVSFLMILSNHHLTNCIIYSEFIEQCCSYNSANRHVWDKPFSLLR